MLGTSEQTANISKTGFAKLGTAQFPSLNRLGLRPKKMVVTNLKVGKKIFSYLCLRFFHQNHSLVTTYCRSLIVGKFLRRCSENFINFPIKHSQDVLGNLQLCFKKYFNVDVFHFSCFAIHLSWFMLC